jgi:acyl-CoA synthetase (AMP-forming)/AMP-acid ligase II
MVELSEIHRTPLGRATIGDQLRRHALNIPRRAAVIAYAPDGTRRSITYAELNADANRMAHAFAERGVGLGDVVAVMSTNSIETIVSYYAALKLGAAYTGVNVMYGTEEIRYQVEHSDPKLVVVASQFADRVEPLRSGRPETTFLAVGATDGLGEGWLGWDETIAGRPTDEPDVEVDEHDIALISYTSGTEASPKGVVIPHRNYLISTATSWTWGLRVTPEDVWLYVMPFYTIAGIGCATSLTLIGATMVLPSSLEPGAALRTIKDEGITVIAQTPTFFLSLCRHESFGPETVGAIERCLTYGGQISPYATEAWSKAVPGVLWGTYWGQSELTQLGSVGWYRSIEEIPDQDPTWIGRPVHHLETRVVDLDGNDAEIGELICRSPSMMLGYHKDPERTEVAMRDGWLHTGDIVRIDEDRNMFFYDRSKDVIKSGGMNVSSQEVERVLQGHPKVLRAAVVGVPDDYWSEKVTAFVIAEDGSDLSEEELQGFCREQMAVFKVPKTIHVVEGFPTDPQGKVLKRELRKTASAANNA